MMKLSASPGRADKYPPPLVRFMKTNVGSRSRGRSRSSPMFLRRKVAGVGAGEEPSSPKVTCMGQVRARRSKSRPNGTNRVGSTRRRCGWVRSALFCGGKLRVGSFRPDLGKWVLFFRVRKPETNRDCAEIEEEPRQRQRVGEQSDGDEEAEVSVSSSINPPINALLLTRCRSAPYRSSSLASKFWGSPLRSEETEEQEQGASETEQFSGEVAGDGDRPRPTSEADPISENSIQKPIIDAESEEKLGLFEEFEGSITETTLKTGEAAGAGGVAGDGRRQIPTSETDSIPRKSDQNPKTDSETEEKSGLFSEFETGEFSGAGGVAVDRLRPKPTSETGSNPLKSVQNPKTDAENGEKSGLFEEFEVVGGAGAVHPLLLTRCKSEPARTAGEKLSPEMSFWRLRRFGVL